MYINKWWGNFIGGSDDALLLVDFLADKAGGAVSLKTILEELHLQGPLSTGFTGDADPYFVARVPRYFEPHFDLAINAVTDLSALVLECAKNGGLELHEISSTRSGRVEITLTDCPDALDLLLDGVRRFCAEPAQFGIHEFLSENELAEFVGYCHEIHDELSAWKT